MLSSEDLPNQPTRQTVVRSAGATPSEQYLKRLCDQSFLSLWSYPGIFRDQGRVNGKGDGKEVCDLLVVFDNNIIIFSDKHIRFDTTDNLELDWSRWFRKAVLKSAQQVWGAERWIQKFPDRLYLDKECTVPFPIVLPDPSTAVFHRIVVAHDASRVCRERLGGSGSLMVDTRIIGEQHSTVPFTIGHLDKEKGYVHVLDDTSLDVVMTHLDTVSDFVAYLAKKEKLLTSGVCLAAAGEEELLARYVAKLNEQGEHDFMFPNETDRVLLEGEWAKFLQSPERQAQVAANDISYSWDALTEKFLYHLMSGTQYETTHTEIAEQEKSFRWLARENRTRRRMLAKGMHELLRRTPANYRAIRVILPSRPGDPHYVLLLLPRYPVIPEQDYRHARSQFLRECCLVVKLEFPDAQHIVGIATETWDGSNYRSEDFVHLDATEWSEALQKQAQASKAGLGILIKTKTFSGSEKEYPIDTSEGAN